MESTTEMGEDAEVDGMGRSGEALEEGVLFDEDLRGLERSLATHNIVSTDAIELASVGGSFVVNLGDADALVALVRKKPLALITPWFIFLQPFLPTWLRKGTHTPKSRL